MQGHAGHPLLLRERKKGETLVIRKGERERERERESVVEEDKDTGIDN